MADCLAPERAGVPSCRPGPADGWLCHSEAFPLRYTAPAHKLTEAYCTRGRLPAERLAWSGGSGVLSFSTGGLRPHNGMVRRGILEVVEFEDGGSHETTRDRY